MKASMEISPAIRSHKRECAREAAPLDGAGFAAAAPETGVAMGRIFRKLPLTEEIVMRRSRVSHFVYPAVVAAAGVLCASTALASQGPGAGPGTASSFTQLAMAILVYGASGLVIGAALIGAARQRLR
jgi:hypothetical protein